MVKHPWLGKRARQVSCTISDRGLRACHLGQWLFFSFTLSSKIQKGFTLSTGKTEQQYDCDATTEKLATYASLYPRSSSSWLSLDNIMKPPR